MIEAYLQERYQDNLSIDWSEYLTRYDLTYYSTNFGFITYKLEGDAVLIYDMYIKPAYRGHTYAWKLHDHVLEEASKEGKRVAITFSDYRGRNHLAGVKAMKVAGFIPAFKTNEEFVFIKGI